MVESPLPIPDTMTKKEIDAITISDGHWREQPEFVCVNCGGVSYLHPYTNQIWGCKKCCFTTYSVSISFAPAVKPDLTTNSNN